MKTIKDFTEEGYSYLDASTLFDTQNLSDEDWDRFVEALNDTFNNKDLEIINNWLYGVTKGDSNHD